MTDDPPAPRHATDPTVLLAAIRALEPDTHGRTGDGVRTVLIILAATWIFLLIAAALIWN